MKNYNLEHCPICGRLPVITDDQGIGDIYCKHCGIVYDKIIRTPMFHYSGKFCTTKKQAINKWNEYARNCTVMK